ncbi:hypothetical protein LRP52_40430 [Photobacterium sp. ZSDE20]|uniref:Uncharacterized protein n=1 Tax=Photobacterium pectinilyticum TaxID=2906793 RepID=A0ABT1NAP5_9GAMM|nr:hypothetical protein [Photobacterium sp. ZSDE20]MCQ1060761.1 hypothetical protein [Photobacterium sp. ZSDE20]MDD1828450.1 hypothetical protein [Photobacterium sp. ZSDE20]
MIKFIKNLTSTIKSKLKFVLAKLQEDFLFMIYNFKEKAKLSLTLLIDKCDSNIEKDTNIVVILFQAVREMLRVIFTQISTSVINYSKTRLRKFIIDSCDKGALAFLALAVNYFISGDYFSVLQAIVAAVILIVIWDKHNANK